MAESKNHIKERQVPFTPEIFDAVEETRHEDGRSFKWQAAALIKEAIEARQAKAAGNG